MNIDAHGVTSITASKIRELAVDGKPFFVRDLVIEYGDGESQEIGLYAYSRADLEIVDQEVPE